MEKTYKKLGLYSVVVSALTLSLGFASVETVSPEHVQAKLSEEKEIVQTMPMEDISETNLLAVNTLDTAYELLLADANDRRAENIYVPETEEEVKEIVKQYYKISTDYLNVRKDPNAQSRITDVLVKGWVVEINGTEANGWLLLNDGGYINGKYATSVEEADAQKSLSDQASKPKPKPVFAQPKPEVKVTKISVQAASATSRDGDNSNTNENDSQQVTSVGSFSSSDVDLLARLVRAESQSEPYAGKVAVALVVLNRIASEEFPDTMQGVIYQSGQFSPVSNGSINRAADNDSIRAAKEAIATFAQANDGSLYFYNPQTASSRWLDGLATSKVIGNHTFKY